MRFLTAGNFLFAALLFFLPWIDVRCESKELGKASLLNQSGMEIATGEYSLSSNMKDLGGGKGGGDQIKEKTKDSKSSGTAPMLWGYLGVLLLAPVGCLLVPKKLWRMVGLICVGLAVGVLATQTAIGFPVAKKLAEQEEANKAAEGAVKEGGLKLDLPKITYVYTPFFYAAWLFTITPLIFIALGKTKEAKYFRKRSRGDENEDEEDERPRRRTRASRDDDEEDAPPPRRPTARRGRDEEDEDDEPPPPPKPVRRVEKKGAEEPPKPAPRKKPPAPRDEDEGDGGNPFNFGS